MHLNLHGYTYKQNDIAWILDGLTPRKGLIQSVTGNVYSMLMDDTQGVENFTDPLLFPLKSHAEIHKQQFLITPTPSISHSVTPTPTRTPRALSPTPTPSSSYVNRPNLLNTASTTWTQTNGSVSIVSSNKLVFTSLANDTTLYATDFMAYGLTTSPTPTVDSLPSFDAVINVDTKTDYHLNIDFEQGTARYGEIFVYLKSGTNYSLVDKTYFHDSYRYSLEINTDTNNQIFIKIKLFQDSRYSTPPKKNYYYTLNNINLVYVRKHIYAPPPVNGHSYDSLVMSLNPIAYWSFNNGLTDTVSGNTIVPKSTDPTIFALKPDSYGNVISLSNSGGADSGATISTPINLGTNNFTIEAWVNVSNYPNWLAIFGSDNGGAFELTDVGQLTFYGSNDYVENDNMYIAPNNDWHLVTTVDEGGNVTFYVNGTPFTNTDLVTETYIFDTVGCDGFTSDGMDGTIGNIAFYSKVLTQEQIQANYAAGTTNYRYSSDIVIPSPTPSATLTPTPSPTPSSFTVEASRYMGRLNPTGMIDNTFDLSLDNFVEGISVSPSGKIYIAGEFGTVSGQTRTGVARLNADGTLDTSFADVNAWPVYYAKEFSNGDIFVCGGFTTVGASNYTGLAKVNSDGTVNTGFTALTFTATANGPSVIKIIQTLDGKYYINGNFNTINGNTYNYLARLNSDGTLDTTFVDQGLTDVYVLEAQSGKIYILDSNRIIRLNSDGTLDNTYSLSLSLGRGKMYQTLDGKIYVGGDDIINARSYTYLFRLNSDGTTDSTFNPLYLNQEITDIKQDSSGKIYLVGKFTPQGTQGSGYNYTSYITRLNSDGTMDSTLPRISFNNSIKVIQIANSGEIYVAGYF